MVTKEEVKFIRKYCVVPGICSTLLIMLFVMTGCWIVFCMMNDIVLNADDISYLGLAVYLVTIVIDLAAFLMLWFRSRNLLQNPMWNDLMKRADQKIASEDGVPTGFDRHAARMDMKRSRGWIIGKDMKTIHEEAVFMARAFQIPFPKIRYRAMAVIVPIAALVGAYGIHAYTWNQTTATMLQTAADSVYALRDALEEGGCRDVYAEDPIEDGFDSWGYYIDGYLTNDWSDSSYISLVVDNDGNIQSVDYRLNVDIELTKEENINNMLDQLTALHDMVISADVPATADTLLEMPDITDEFLEQFIENSYYDDGLYVYGDNCYIGYSTYSQEEYDEYSQSYIYVFMDD